MWPPSAAACAANAASPSPCTRTPTPTRSAPRRACSICSRSSASRPSSTSPDGRTPAARRRPSARRRVRPRRCRRRDAALYVLDSGIPTRAGAARQHWDGVVVNIDHHHDNPRFGDARLRARRAPAARRARLRHRRARSIWAVAGRPPRRCTRASPSTRATSAMAARRRPRSGTLPGWSSLGVDVTAVYARALRAALAGGRCASGRGPSPAHVPVAGGRALVAAVTSRDYAATGAGDGRHRGHRRQPALPSTASRSPPS